MFAAPSLLALAILSAQDAPEPTEQLVRIALVSEVELVRPGDSFRVGLRFDLAPQHHIYWENAGQSGMPTRAQLSGPDGFTISEPRFPGPERIEAAGGIVSYGYENQAMLLFDVRAPEALAAGSELGFEARASWLVCKEACFLGDGKAALALKSVAADAAEPERSTERLQPFASRLPRPFEDFERAKASWEGTLDEPLLKLVLPCTDPVEYFSIDEPGLELQGEVGSPTEDSTTITRSYRFRPRTDGAQPRARGVIGVGAKEKRVFYELERAWPSGKREAGERGQ